MYLSETLEKIKTILIAEFSEEVEVDISPLGQPTPSHTRPFLGIGQGSVQTIPQDQTVKYVTHVELTGTIRTRPAIISKYKTPYLALVSYMTRTSDTLTGNTELFTYFKEGIDALDVNYTGISGYFLVESINLTPRKAMASWFNSEDESHGDRDIGYILTATLRFPYLFRSLSC